MANRIEEKKYAGKQIIHIRFMFRASFAATQAMLMTSTPLKVCAAEDEMPYSNQEG